MQNICQGEALRRASPLYFEKTTDLIGWAGVNPPICLLIYKTVGEQAVC